SGLHLQDTGAVYLCFRGLGAYQTPTAGCYPVNATADTICSVYTINKTDALNGNDGSISINMLGGQAPFTFAWNDGDTDSVRNNLQGDWYYVTITDAGGCAETDSVAISTTCTASVSVTPGRLGNYTFTAAGSISSYQHYVWVIGGDTISQDSTASLINYHFDTAGTHSVCLSVINDFYLCTYDTCFDVIAENVSYVHLLDSINIWHYTGNMSAILPTTPINSRDNTCGSGNSWVFQNSIEFTGIDTIISDKSYKTLWGQNHSQVPLQNCVIGFIREIVDSGKIYFLRAENSTEILLYDFSMKPGDTIFLHFENGNLFETGWYRLDSIRPFNIEHTNTPKRQFFLNNISDPYYYPFSWVEGVGTLFELLYPYNYFGNGFGGQFNCQEYSPTISGQILICYEHESLEFYAACAMAFAQSVSCFQYQDTCNYVGYCGSINELSSIAAIDIFPNPAKEDFTMHMQVKQTDKFSVRLLDLHGRSVSPVTYLGLLSEGEHSKQIKLPALPSGLYFVECSTAEGSLYKKLVVE
ncbi:MAG TPA: T9SS type A sorting domain-containing protein, partial [Chitinophagales bacterium]|nr:T9SS type A sorting domain-containing protein [Chitinophagales bacterium]